MPHALVFEVDLETVVEEGEEVEVVVIDSHVLIPLWPNAAEFLFIEHIAPVSCIED